MYRGWRGTKLHLAILTMVLVVFGYWMTGFKPELYDAYCMALLAAAGIYSGAVVTAEKLSGKHGAPPPTP